MQILAINWQDLSNPRAGGAEIHFHEIFRRIVQKGYSVTLLCSHYTGAKEYEEVDGIRIIRKGSWFVFNFAAFWEVRKILKQEKYDLVIEDINKLPFYSYFWHNLPLLVIVHHFFDNAIFREVNPVFGTYVFLSERSVSRLYKNKRFLAVSQSTKEELLKRGISEQNIKVIYCGIDHQLFKVNPDYKKDIVPTILYLGRLKKYKSVDLLIKALPLVLEKVPNARLVIVGEGDYKPELQNLARNLELEDRIIFTGFVDARTKVEWLRRAWVTVYPSVKEGWGLTNIEANACGTPAIASDVPGLRESVLPGRTGFLFKYGDIEELSDRIIKITTDKELRDNFSKEGILWASNFSWDKVASDVEELLRDVVASKSNLKP
ncbi:MAG TPA: glycosyltransferase family 4 protein [Terriglobales bacterium]|nr:glycosyltransferase family 4 protein [Terriglobales bacterium]